MDLKIVKKFIELAKKENVASLKYETDDMKISVSLPVTQTNSHMVSAPTVAPPAATMDLPSTPKGALDSSLTEVKSPFVGTFYRSASPNDPPFVKVGDNVGPGQTLCILEAMKIMNEIDAEITGEITEICVENESLVEFGQVLFKVRK